MRQVGGMAQISQAGVEKHTSQVGPVEQMIQAGECLRHLCLCKALRSVSGSGHEPELGTPT